MGQAEGGRVMEGVPSIGIRHAGPCNAGRPIISSPLAVLDMVFHVFQGLYRKAITITTQYFSFESFLIHDITRSPTSVTGFGDLFKGYHPHKGTLALKHLRGQIGDAVNPRAAERVRS